MCSMCEVQVHELDEGVHVSHDILLAHEVDSVILCLVTDSNTNQLLNCVISIKTYLKLHFK